jgi:NDP-sugar pyrophosphorylase family protein
VLNLHHKPETITREVGDGRALGVRVRYSWEDPILGSGGGPRRALPILGTPTFIIVNGDTLTNLDLEAMWRMHRSSGAPVTLAVVKNPRPDKYGGVVVDDRGRVTGFVRRGVDPSAYHFIGVQIASASVFSDLEDNQPAESVSGLYPHLLARDPRSVCAYLSDAEFQDVGTPRDYLDTALRVADREGTRNQLVSASAKVAQDAMVSDSILWDNVRIGARCRVVRCVVGDAVDLPAGGSYADQAIVNSAGGGLRVVSL